MNKILTIAMVLLFASTGFSQVNQYLSYKYLYPDYLGPIDGQYFQFAGGQVVGGQIGYHRDLSDIFRLNVPLRIGKIQYPTSASDASNFEQETFLGIDATLAYKFNNGSVLKKNAKLAPYLLAGLGASYLEDAGKAQFNVPLGVGLNWQVVPGFALQAQTEYRISEFNHMHHSLGAVFQLSGNKEDVAITAPPVTPDPTPEPVAKPADTDGDGIGDDADKCPNVAGVALFEGCPDTDGDGVQDSKDNCPKIAGKLNGCPDADSDGVADNKDMCPNIAGKLNGCPDADGDGIKDSDDSCPNKKGIASFAGCPDTDRDGVQDSKDACPTVAGIASFAGCPDTDGDGIQDSKDACPTVAGIAANNGCAAVEEEVKKVLSFAKRGVKFETSSNIIKTSSYTILNQVVDIMKAHPEYNLRIEGHTDSQGREDSNLQLSKRRAKACMDYIVNKGVSPSRITYNGYGESRPIADNSTAAGKAENRRVEFDIYFKGN